MFARRAKCMCVCIQRQGRGVLRFLLQPLKISCKPSGCRRTPCGFGVSKHTFAQSTGSHKARARAHTHCSRAPTLHHGATDKHNAPKNKSRVVPGGGASPVNSTVYVFGAAVGVAAITTKQLCVASSPNMAVTSGGRVLVIVALDALKKCTVQRCGSVGWGPRVDSAGSMATNGWDARVHLFGLGFKCLLEMNSPCPPTRSCENHLCRLRARNPEVLTGRT